jgi:hypothetical protein
VDERRRRYPEEFHGKILAEVALEMGCDASTIGKYLRHPDGARGSSTEAAIPQVGARPYWTRDLQKQAIRWWWGRYGHPPTRTDWSRAALKERRDRVRVEEGLRRLDEGWVDTHGTHRRFPNSVILPLRTLIAEIEQEDH